MTKRLRTDEKINKEINENINKIKKLLLIKE